MAKSREYIGGSILIIHWRKHSHQQRVEEREARSRQITQVFTHPAGNFAELSWSSSTGELMVLSGTGEASTSFGYYNVAQ